MANLCPSCHAELPAGSINIAEGVAMCPACGVLSRLRDVVKRSADSQPADPAPPGPPPQGCRVVDDGVRTTLVVRSRSVTSALALLFFAAFWNSIVSVFVAVLAGAYWTRWIGPLPEWAPLPTANSGGVERGDPHFMPLGVMILMTLFLTPFVLVGLGLIAGVCMALAGRVEVTLGAIEGSVFTGIGPIGWTRRFDPRRVRSVRLKRSGMRSSGQRAESLVIESDRSIRAAATCRPEQRRWLAAELRQRLRGLIAE